LDHALSHEAHHARVAIEPFALHPTVDMQSLGRFDPSVRRSRDRFQKVCMDADGRVVVWQIALRPHGIVVQLFNSDADALDRFVAQFPLADGADSFLPEHAVLGRVACALQGLRLIRVPWLFDVAAGAVLQQRVRWKVAYDDFRRIAQRWGTRTAAGTAFPSATQLAAVPISRVEALGIDGKRARALIGLARAESRRSFLRDGVGAEELRVRLLGIRGIGPWTAGTIAGFGLGDPDAVPVGDLHLPSLVTSALAGEAEGTDERMLELLEPYRGHRFRVIRLLSWASRHAPHTLVGSRAGGCARVACSYVLNSVACSYV
jgi:3-methyladenine DNA glycosylase/8-oxoguanine DNA glycosylase